MSFTHLDAVLDEVRPLGQIFADSGHRLFLVGGIVRDQWLDVPLDDSSDIDLTTDAHPGDIKTLVAPIAHDLWTQGEKFGTIGLRAGGRAFEITTHRAESYDADSRKPQVSFGDDIATDLSRRDFTVNAMAIELPDGDLVDPYGGVQDLGAGRLRTPLSPQVSFNDDPLRMLRAARFAAKYRLQPDPGLIDAASALRERIRIVAIERIEVELRRLLGVPDAVTGLRFLAETGVLGEVLAYGAPSLLDRVTERADAAITLVGELDADWHVRLAAIGMGVFGTPEEVRAMCTRLRLSSNNARTVYRLCGSAQAIGDLTGAGERDHVAAPELRGWLRDSDPQNRTQAIRLARALAADPTAVDRFDASLSVLTTAEQTDDLTFLDGKQIMDLLGIGPGRIVGRAHDFLRDAYVLNGPMSEQEQVRKLRDWYDSQS